MRRIIFFILCILPLCISAQNNNYKPILEKGKIWVFNTTVNYLFDEEDQDFYDSNKISRQYTVSPLYINERTGKYTLRMAFDNEGMDENTAIADDYFVLKEQDKALYCLYGSYMEEGLNPLIDFNLKKGDSFVEVYDVSEPDYGDKYHIIDEDYISVRGHTYRRFAIGDKNGNLADYWVEGIGSKNRLYMSASYVTLERTIGGTHYYKTGTSLVAVYQDGELIFERKDFDAPGNPTYIATVNAINPVVSDIYDLQGRRYKSFPFPGVFIQNGKKIVWK